MSCFRPFFSQFVLCLTSNNSTSHNVGGRMHAWAVPHLQLFWGPQSHQVSARDSKLLRLVLSVDLASPPQRSTYYSLIQMAKTVVTSCVRVIGRLTYASI